MTLRRPRPGINDEHGGSVVETALIVPIFVVLVYWSALFYDIVQLRLKVQETARFAAWEMTAYELSDYRTGNHDAAFAMAVGGVTARTNTLYSSLHSEDEGGPMPRLMVTYDFGGVSITNQEVGLAGAAAQQLNQVIDNDMGEIALEVMDRVDNAFRWVLDHYGFNTRGLVTAEATAQLRPRLIPQTLLQAEDGGFYSNRIIEATQYNLRARAAVVADGWTLHDGRDVFPSGSGSIGNYGDNPFFAQVNRTHMLGLHQLGPIGTIVDTLHDLQAWIEDFVPLPLFTRAHLASRNYRFGDERDHHTLDSGPGSQRQFHTAPAQEHCERNTCPWLESDYTRTLRMRSGEQRGSFYMGCPVGQRHVGNCDWNNVQ